MSKKNIFPLVEYIDACPIDGKRLSFSEIFAYGMCNDDFSKFKKSIWELQKEVIDPEKLDNFKDNYLLERKLNEFIDFFKKSTKNNPLSLQIYWAKRALKRESFSIIAPTGIGKTTFGIMLANFIKGKTYYLVPSKILLREIEEKIKKINSDRKVIVIKEGEDKKLIEQDFDILVTTSHFLHRNFELIPKNFDLIFIDDADSLVRQPKNIDKILKLVNFKENEIEEALSIITKKRGAKSKEDYEKIGSLRIDKSKKGTIIAASATLTPKTKRVFLFRELLNFDIGSSTTYLRNIVEVYEKVKKQKIWQRSVYWLKKLGDGGFVFLNDDFSKDELNLYLSFLREKGIKAISYEKFISKNKEKFVRGEIDIIVGFSNIRNPLTRGIDIPERVRYALFVGVPKFKLPLKSNYSPLHLFLLGLSLREILEDEEKKSLIEKNLNFLKKISFLKEEQVLEDENLKAKIEPIKKVYDQILADRKKLIQKISRHPNLTLEIKGDYLLLIISDPRGYLQASGRTSRLFPLGLTKGLSLILVEDEKTLKHLNNKLRIIGYDPNFRKIDQIDLKKVIEEIDNDREIIKKIQRGEEMQGQDPIKTALIIVESPTKAKTIANFFGKPARRSKGQVNFYEISLGNLHLNICATLGHFVDLVHNKNFYGVKKEGNHFIPIFQIAKICRGCQRHLDEEENVCQVCQSNEFITKRELVEYLKDVASEVNQIYLATDPDAEGEKIAFDLFAYLYPINRNIARIKLHEITRAEFLKKIKQPEEINLNLVKSQLVRRISDRWIGFKLSEEIQKNFKNLNLSAGRVQTPVLGWILEKEKRIKNKHYQIKVITDNITTIFFSNNLNTVRKLKSKFKEGGLNLEIESVDKKIEKINPLPPYETGDLLKDAFSFFRFDTQLTMRLAQELFESGLITYHRTDSTFISSFGQNIAREYLEKNNLTNIFEPRYWGKSGTHEAIRPTRPVDVQDLIEESIINPQRNLSKKHFQLYGLIFNRFISSQMKESKAQKEEFLIKLNNLTKKEIVFTKIEEENHLKFFRNIRMSNLIAGIFKVQNLSCKKVSKEFHYTQGQLIDEMKKKGLGRPSTYSLIVQTITERKYIIDRSGYLIPTSWGERIHNYLQEKYPDLISEKYTIKLEKKMDLVAEGKVNYQNILSQTFTRIFGND
ncbi:MAG: reverse gyrase [Patescibacteria group bacterium]|nr:reverse gyrase [Patescibacteria group bacterium]